MTEIEVAEDDNWTIKGVGGITAPVEGSRYYSCSSTQWHATGTERFWIKPLYEDLERGKKTTLPHLRTTRGAIVNIGSIEGIGANPAHAAYCASKAGLHGLTRAVAVDHGAEGIRCNAVAPGWIDTDLNEDFIENMPDPIAFRRDIGRIHPIGRTGKPEEVAALVAWLASEEAGFVTGQIWTVDGGRMAKLSLP
jgi:NAD(P)-dependent dehydrogenase (short-subunit alcohol dehydrogenase family)